MSCKACRNAFALTLAGGVEETEHCASLVYSEDSIGSRMVRLLIFTFNTFAVIDVFHVVPLEPIPRLQSFLKQVRSLMIDRRSLNADAVQFSESMILLPCSHHDF